MAASRVFWRAANYLITQLLNYTLLTILGIALFILLISIRQINQYERGVKFQFGKYSSIMNPGWRLVWPIVQTMQKVDMRVKVNDVPDQDAITKDNVSVNVNAVLYYKVTDAKLAIIEVEDFMYAVSQLIRPVQHRCLRHAA